MRRGTWCPPTFRNARSRSWATCPVPNRNIPSMARPMRKAGPRSPASIASRPRPRAPSSNCICNGRPTGAWSGARSNSRRPTPPPPRKVRLATIHYKPTGKSPRQNCEEYAPLIAEAAKQKADLVVLGETVPSVGVKQKPHEMAEAIPGPTTDYFGELARKHNLHIVLSLHERDGHLVYNAAVLLGPDGKLIGKYRKVCLPPGEVEAGIAPGSDYPVFDTKFGKVGLMICYDGFFPEVARELSNRGAEVIAWPVWGCNPLLAQARACENHVYLVSSTFMEPKARLDDLGGLRSDRQTDRPGREVGHGRRRRSRFEPALHRALQPRRLPRRWCPGIGRTRHTRQTKSRPASPWTRS